MHKYRIYITTKNYLTLPIIIEAETQGTAQLLAKSMYPDAKSIGTATKIR